MTFRVSPWQGRWRWLLFVIIALLLIAMMVAVLDDLGSRTERLIGGGVSLTAIVLLAVMYSWITIEPQRVRFGYFPIYKRTLDHNDIQRISRVTVSPFRDFGSIG